MDPTELAASRAWLRQFPKLKRVNRRGTTYGLKHVAEPEAGYTDDATFIEAARLEGFTVERFGGTAHINISRRAWAN